MRATSRARSTAKHKHPAARHSLQRSCSQSAPYLPPAPCLHQSETWTASPDGRLQAHRLFPGVPARLPAQAGLWLFALRVKVQGVLTLPISPLFCGEHPLSLQRSLTAEHKGLDPCRSRGLRATSAAGQAALGEGSASRGRAEGELWASSPSVGSFTKRRADASKQ